jgi:hypothetical protein
VTVALEGVSVSGLNSARSWLQSHSLGATAWLLAWLSWPVVTLAPCGALDCSWRFALHESFRNYWSGTRVTIFTYGPLGFLSAPQLWSRATAILSVSAVLLVQVALALLLLRRLTGLMSLLPGAVVAYFLLRVQGENLGETSDLVVLLVAVSLLWSERKRPRAWLLALSAASGVLLLVKFSGGVLACILTVVTAFFIEPERGLGSTPRLPGLPRWAVRLLSATLAGVVSLASMAVVFMAVTGQPERLPGWFRGSMAVTSGYGVMALEVGAHREYVYGAVLLAGLVVLALLTSRRRASDAGVVLMLGAVAYLKFREGFERHDGGHMLLFASAIALLPWLMVRAGVRPALLWAAAGLSAGAITLSVNVGAGGPRDLLQLYDGPRRAVTQLHELASSSQSAQVQLAAKASIRSELGVPDSALQALRGRPMDTSPWDTVVAWAYGLRWKPLDVWALYSSYAPTLDHADALSVSRGYGPDLLLRRMSDTGVDGRFSGFEPPEMQRTLACSWRRVVASGGWEVLGRGADRCGTPRRLSSARAVPSQVVDVPLPAAGNALMVTIAVHQGLFERLRSAVFKPSRAMYISLDGDAYRFVPATGPDGLLLVAPSPLLPPGGSSRVSVRRLVLSGPFTSADLVFSELPVSAVGR